MMQGKEKRDGKEQEIKGRENNGGGNFCYWRGEKKKKPVINISYKGKKIHRKGEKTNLPERRQKI